MAALRMTKFRTSEHPLTDPWGYYHMLKNLRPTNEQSNNNKVITESKNKKCTFEKR